MRWPDAPTCHGAEAGARWKAFTIQGTFAAGHGEPPTPDAMKWFRQCTWCGSLHPEDLIIAIERGAVLSSADWKYGWPHKFYLDRIWNPTPNVHVLRSARYKDDKISDVVWGPAGELHAKWYTTHVSDEGYDDDAWGRLTRVVSDKTGIAFVRGVEGVMWLKQPP